MKQKYRNMKNKNEKLIIPFKGIFPKTRHQAQWHKVDVEQTFTESLNKIRREVTTLVALSPWTSFHSSLAFTLPSFPRIYTKEGYCVFQILN